MDGKNRALIIIFVLIFSLLSLRLVYLQVAQHRKLSQMAIENAAKTVIDPAPRGVVYDRNGKTLVENQAVFSVHILPYVLLDMEKVEQEEILESLGVLLGENVELKISANEPIIVKDKIPLQTAIRIEEKQLPGIVVRSRPVRFYPHGHLAAHLLGYVGEIEAHELKSLKHQGYRLGSVIGKDGVEKVYDQQLRGIDGGRKVQVDVHGVPLKVLESQEPVAGNDMRLTIDLDLQKAAEKALEKYEGAVVVMNPNNGEILAMASHPYYDPSIFAKEVDKKEWKKLGYKKYPFMNRALAIYPPGSIFKVITLAAALETEEIDPYEIVNCRGYYNLNGRIAKCWLEGGHGPVSIMEGLVWSCDVVFYELGRRLGPEKMSEFSRKFGLGSKTGIDLPQDKMGTVADKKWKKKYLNQPWYEGDSINYAIGQGFLEVSPLQMAVVYGGIATGKFVRPHVIETDEEPDKKVPISSRNLELIQQILREVVKRGTGVAANVAGIPAAGKTGTAENPGKPHAWFICYAPYDDPEIVIAAFVAHGEHGDQASAYVARDILKWYKENRLEKQYPAEKYTGQYILQRNKHKVPYRVVKENLQTQE